MSFSKLKNFKASSWMEVREQINSSDRLLIDLRSPKEFALGAIPCAVNIPLLDNSERHQVGLTYKTVGKLEAVQMGLELFADKAEKFLNQIMELAGEKKLVVHCWRGGMRSQLVAQWLTLAGLEVELLKGGYKAFRKVVLLSIDELAKHDHLVLNGRTGSGKTQIIEKALEMGLPAIDLEGIAHHRGSAFGGMAQKFSSPTQQGFENNLANEFLKIKNSKKILLEIESYIGPVVVPSVLRKKIFSSKMLFVEKDFSDRVSYLTKIYVDNWDDEAKSDCFEKLEMLSRYLSKEEKTTIANAIENDDFPTAVSMLLKLRYDKTYDKTIKRTQSQSVAKFNISHQFGESMKFIENYLQT